MTNKFETSLEKIASILSGAAIKKNRDAQIPLQEIADNLAGKLGAAGMPAATATAAGKVELATTAEAQLGSDTARAVTPAGLLTGLKNLHLISFLGVAAPGPCTASGLHVGDIVVAVASTVTLGALYDKFESTISVINQIQQTAAEDLSTEKPIALIYRPS